MTTGDGGSRVTSIALLSRDLMFSSRVMADAQRAGIDVVRAEDPDRLPEPAEGMLVVVDWGSRAAGWDIGLSVWMRTATPAPRLVLFGPHADVEAAREARQAGLGPVIARSRLADRLRELLEPMTKEATRSGRGA